MLGIASPQVKEIENVPVTTDDTTMPVEQGQYNGNTCPTVIEPVQIWLAMLAEPVVAQSFSVMLPATWHTTLHRMPEEADSTCAAVTCKAASMPPGSPGVTPWIGPTMATAQSYVTV